MENIILKKGDIVKLKNGESLAVNGFAGKSLKEYNYSYSEKVVEVKRPVKYEIIYKAPPEILDKEEKEYLSAVIKPFRNQVQYIIKQQRFAIPKQWIFIVLEDGDMSLPYFNIGTMYKGMEANREYTLEELGLFK